MNPTFYRNSEVHRDYLPDSQDERNRDSPTPDRARTVNRGFALPSPNHRSSSINVPRDHSRSQLNRSCFEPSPMRQTPESITSQSTSNIAPTSLSRSWTGTPNERQWCRSYSQNRHSNSGNNNEFVAERMTILHFSCLTRQIVDKNRSHHISVIFFPDITNKWAKRSFAWTAFFIWSLAYPSGFWTSTNLICLYKFNWSSLINMGTSSSITAIFIVELKMYKNDTNST